MSLPTLGSPEFYAVNYPKAKENTIKGVQRIINNLTKHLQEFPGDLLGWLALMEENAHRYKERFLFLRKYNGSYWHCNLSASEQKYLEIQARINRGENVTVKASNSNKGLHEAFKQLDGVIADWRERTLDPRQPFIPLLLFGAYLPPRRHDCYQLQIRSSHTDEKINYYHKGENLFVFNKFKNDCGESKVQRYQAQSLSCLYDDQVILNRAIGFLNSLPDGPLFKIDPNKISDEISNFYGCCNNTLRKYWATQYHNKLGDKQQKVMLAKWMDHNLEIAIMNYLIEDGFIDSVRDETLSGYQANGDLILEEEIRETKPLESWISEVKPLESAPNPPVSEVDKQRIIELEAAAVKDGKTIATHKAKICGLEKEAVAKDLLVSELRQEAEQLRSDLAKVKAINERLLQIVNMTC